MEVRIFPDHDALSQHTADIIATLIRKHPSAAWCMASGETPRRTCQLLVQKASNESLDLTSSFFFGLDEWVGVPPDNKGSCRFFFENELFEPLGFGESSYHLFDALSADLKNECRRMDDLIKQKGGIELIIVGIGMNGHIGFNEPGIPFNSYSHVANLDETTTTVGQKYFQTETKLDRGITIGLQHLIEAQEAILLANGSRKAEVISRTVQGPLDNLFPASIMQSHKNGKVLADKEASALLTNK